MSLSKGRMAHFYRQSITLDDIYGYFGKPEPAHIQVRVDLRGDNLAHAVARHNGRRSVLEDVPWKPTWKIRYMLINGESQQRNRLGVYRIRRLDGKIENLYHNLWCVSCLPDDIPRIAPLVCDWFGLDMHDAKNVLLNASSKIMSRMHVRGYAVTIYEPGCTPTREDDEWQDVGAEQVVFEDEEEDIDDED